MAKKFKRRVKKSRPKTIRSKSHQTWRDVGATAGTVAYKGFKLAKKLAALINVEHKFYDVANDISSSGWNSSIQYCIAPLCDSGQINTNFPGINPGSGPNNIIGQSIKLESLFIRGKITISPNAWSATPDANPYCTVRMVLVYDTDTSGSGPTDPLQSPPIGQTADQVIWPMTMVEPDRYKILKDKTWVLNVNNNYTVAFKVFKQLDTHLKYNSDQTIMMSGNYYIWFTTTSLKQDHH